MYLYIWIVKEISQKETGKSKKSGEKRERSQAKDITSGGIPTSTQCHRKLWYVNCTEEFVLSQRKGYALLLFFFLFTNMSLDTGCSRGDKSYQVILILSMSGQNQVVWRGFNMNYQDWSTDKLGIGHKEVN